MFERCHARWLASCLAAILSLPALTALGATALAPAAPAAKPAAEPASQEPESITEWSQHALARIGEIRVDLTVAGITAAQSAAFEAAHDRFAKQLEQLSIEPGRLADLSDTALKDAAYELNAIADAVDAVDRAVEGRAVKLEKQLGELTALHDEARARLADRSIRVLPDALIARLHRVVAEIEPLSADVRERLESVAALQNRILAMNERTEAARDALARASASRLRGLLQFDQPPLWTTTASALASSARHSSDLALRHAPDTVARFLRNEFGRIVLHLMLLALLLALLAALKRSHDATADARVTSRALERPVSAGVLVALLMTPLLYVDAPLLVRSVIAVAMLMAMLRILTLYADRSLWAQLFTITGLAVFERLMSAVSVEVLTERLALLALSLVTVATLGWSIAWHAERALGLSPPRQRYVRALLLGSMVLTLASAIFNVLGNGSLAALIQAGAVNAIMLAAGLHAGVRVLNEIAQLVADALERRGVRSVMRNRAGFVRSITRLNTFFGVLIWAYYSTILFGVGEPLMAALRSVLAAEWTLGAVSLSPGRVVAFVIAVWLAMKASRLTQIVLNDDVLPKFLLPRGVPNAISTFANYSIVVIGVFVGAGILGIGLSNLALIVGALGVGIGFGLQNIVNNFVSGLILLFERPVQVGDAVQLGAVSGRITRIGFRASQVRTYNGSEVVVPNGELVSTQLINWTLSDRRRRLELSVGVAYGTDPDRVSSMLAEVLETDPEVLVDPAPIIVFEAFGDSALTFRIMAWIADFENGWKSTHRINVAIARAFAAEGIEVPFPQRDLHVRSMPS